MVYRVNFTYSMQKIGTDFLQEAPRFFAILTNGNGMVQNKMTWHVPPRIEIELTEPQYNTLAQGPINLEFVIGSSARPYYESTDSSLAIGLTATPLYYWYESLRRQASMCTFKYFMVFDLTRTKYNANVKITSPELPGLPDILLDELETDSGLLYAVIPEEQYLAWKKEHLKGILNIKLGQ